MCTTEKVSEMLLRLAWGVFLVLEAAKEVCVSVALLSQMHKLHVSARFE
jgi:hypothetical protein